MIFPKKRMQSSIEKEFNEFVKTCFKHRISQGQKNDLKRTFAAGAVSMVKILGESLALKEPEAEESFANQIKDTMAWAESLLFDDSGRN